MSKRFTDINKWRNEWFRTLPEKAKLAWIYICDECDFAGIWKADYGLASFQLGFKVTTSHLQQWFGDKIHFFGTDQVLILSFFEFQYGESKDTWNAKIRAQSRIESFGFSFANGRIVILQEKDTPTTVGGQSPDCLSIVIGKGIGIGNTEGGVGETKPKPSDFEQIYQAYPRKLGKAEGLRKVKGEIKTFAELELLAKAVFRYAEHCTKNQTEAKYIKHFSSFMSCWRDWLDPETGGATVSAAKNGHEQWMEEQLKKEAAV